MTNGKPPCCYRTTLTIINTHICSASCLQHTGSQWTSVVRYPKCSGSCVWTRPDNHKASKYIDFHQAKRHRGQCKLRHVSLFCAWSATHCPILWPGNCMASMFFYREDVKYPVHLHRLAGEQRLVQVQSGYVLRGGVPPGPMKFYLKRGMWVH